MSTTSVVQTAFSICSSWAAAATLPADLRVPYLCPPDRERRLEARGFGQRLALGGAVDDVQLQYVRRPPLGLLQHAGLFVHKARLLHEWHACRGGRRTTPPAALTQPWTKYGT
jgi:hypothetical protein